MRTAALLAACLTSACAGSWAQVRQPAVIVYPDAASRAELLALVRGALAGAPLLLADDALTRDSALIVERMPRKDATGLPINSRNMGMPERFLLFTQGSDCLLVHERTNRHWLLRYTQCRAYSSAGTQ